MDGLWELQILTENTNKNSLSEQRLEQNVCAVTYLLKINFSLFNSFETNFGTQRMHGANLFYHTVDNNSNITLSLLTWTLSFKIVDISEVCTSFQCFLNRL